ncbi:hypothetical protein FZC33_12455 [Labrys sp. KNU-23]|uniref:hypothetical protein n=1 Tax=Labrys sp. KNU-23 TaxID=2789216 RepID=UPI0011EC686F|nr:hypothetical protein [Labrys sp. KNU-23]QEN87090.1 hypothetical protein FZC33_12455 [Labrys sp. KNU-23]
MLAILLCLALAALLPIGLALWLLSFAYKVWNKPQPRRTSRRVMIVSLSLSGLGAVLFVTQSYNRQMLLARVPAPLEVARVEYRLEESWGLGFMPGDNETGFIVYRLTEQSAQWARNQKSQLGKRLPGGGTQWHSTPVSHVGNRDWHPYDDEPSTTLANREPLHSVTIAEYLEKYGFLISIEKGRDAQADQAIREAGSFYAYGRGGSITIVDPARGKVYFAYAG